MLQFLEAVGGKEVEPPSGGADPLAVGAIDSDARNVLVGHQILDKLAVADDDIRAVDRRFLAMAAVVESLIGIEDNLDALVGADPNIAEAVLGDTLDRRCLQFATVIGVDKSHTALIVEDEDTVGTASEKLIVVDAVAENHIQFVVGGHSIGVEALPGAIGMTDSDRLRRERIGSPKVALAVESEGSRAEHRQARGGVEREQSAGGVAGVEALDRVAVRELDDAMAPRCGKAGSGVGG